SSPEPESCSPRRPPRALLAATAAPAPSRTPPAVPAARPPGSPFGRLPESRPRPGMRLRRPPGRRLVICPMGARPIRLPRAMVPLPHLGVDDLAAADLASPALDL